MNEITKIHLGRQAFTISLDAHHELNDYLHAIDKQVGDKEVLEEIELRMAELLLEHGISANKVVLLGDVNYLKEQLGSPQDFKEDEDQPESTNNKHAETKRLFRNTDNAMVAGVASGLAEYFGLDVLLIRILIIVFVLITAGWGILLYIALWLLVPEAKTSSDRLKMAGKPVTVNGLREIVERADVGSAARRANATVAGPINTIFRIFLKLIGLFFIFSGLSAIFALVSLETYVLLNNNALIQDNIFPIGLKEHLLLDTAILVVGLIALFIVLFGIAIFRRKWPLKTWVTGMFIGLILIGLAIGGAMTADVYPTVRDRYNANLHTSVRTASEFNTLDVINGNGVGVNVVPSSRSYISFNYYGHPNLASIKTYVENKNLYIDTSQFNWHRNCQTICLPNNYNMNITVYTPNATQIMNQNDYYNAAPPQPPTPVLKAEPI